MDFGAAVALRDCVFFAGVVADAFEVVSPGFTDTAGFVGAAGSVDVCSGDAVGTGSSVSVGSFVSTGGPDTTGVFVGAGVIFLFLFPSCLQLHIGRLFCCKHFFYTASIPPIIQRILAIKS